MKKEKILHIGIIILGIMFICIPAFHSSLWFDESYSVAISNKNFDEIWKITGNDVHPALYYWLLHIIYLIFGYNIFIYRFFSVFAIAILGILGYTHIKKDFGEKTGIVFSFLTFFLPIMNTYAQEIRMYSWSCLIVTLMGIYAYRFYKSISAKNEKIMNKNLIMFGIFSIGCCYIHYYALITTSFVNLLLLIYVIKNAKKNKKALINFLIIAVVQILLYIPWIIYFIRQLNHVKSGFWIKIGLINTTVEILSFQFRRQLDTNFTFNIQTIVSLVLAVLIYVYLIVKSFLLMKKKQNIKPAILGALVYIGVIAIVRIISFKTPVLYSRYLLVMTGFYIFALSYIISKERNKIVFNIIWITITIASLASNIQNVLINYDSSNCEVYNYINNQIKDDDIIIYSNIGNGGVIAAYFPYNNQFFLNFSKWDVEEAYKAYGPGMKTVYDWEFLKDFKGRIWLIDSENMGLYNNEFQKVDTNVIKESRRFETKYHDYIYNIMLLQKE